MWLFAGDSPLVHSGHLYIFAFIISKSPALSLELSPFSALKEEEVGCGGMAVSFLFFFAANLAVIPAVPTTMNVIRIRMGVEVFFYQ